MTKTIRALLSISIASSYLFLFGCSLTPRQAQTPLAQCEQQLAAIQSAIEKHHTRDAQYQTLPHFPTYRTNRFWSSFKIQDLTPQQEEQWRQTLHQFGMSSLEVEWRNLPGNVRRTQPFNEFKSACDQLLLSESMKQAITEADFKVEDSYNDWLRFFGLYALIKYGAEGSIAEYQEEMRQRIEEFDGFTGVSNLFQPRKSSINPPIRELLENAYHGNALGVPELSAEHLQMLMAAHAPNVLVAYESDADLPGTARWNEQSGHLQRHVDHGQAVVYTYPSYIRYNQRILLQLNYTLWFSERPKPTEDDWYGGKLDGLVWRVTLNTDGSVLMYDSIHPCGCYHTVHVPVDSPLHRTVFALDQSESPEPIMFFSNTLQSLDASQDVNLQLYLESGTHYLVKVGRSNSLASVTTYEYKLADYDSLRSLPVSNGDGDYRSWFDNNGLIAESARRERYFLWPLGVESAGAMRQQGNHAIAFVGKRHFDEASVEKLLNLPGQ